MEVRLCTTHTHVDLVIQSVTGPLILTSQIGYLFGLLGFVRCDFGPLEMVFFRRSKCENWIFTNLTAWTEFELVHTEGVWIGGFGTVGSGFCLDWENLQKSIFSVHGVTRFCVSCVLLNVEKQTGSLAQELESSLFNIGNLFSFHKDGSHTFPLALHHMCELLKLADVWIEIRDINV